jgi:hypothetical protein
MIALCMLSFCNLHVCWHGFPSQVFWCIVVCSQISVLNNNYSRCNQLSLNTLNSLGFFLVLICFCYCFCLFVFVFCFLLLLFLGGFAWLCFLLLFFCCLFVLFFVDLLCFSLVLFFVSLFVFVFVFHFEIVHDLVNR